MTAPAHAAGTHHNWRRILLYGFEVVFALIAGSSEATIYYAYSPPSPWGWTRIAEAGARAAITQIAVVFFAVAAVEAASRVRSIPGKVLAAIPAYLATFVAATITYWLMRDAALIFRDAVFLAPAETGGIVLPIIGYVSNRDVDVNMIAAIPAFVVGLNMLAPIIAAPAVQETTEARQERQQREREEAQHKADMRALNAGGWGRTLRAGIEAATQGVSAGDTGGNTTGNDAANTVQSPDDPDTQRQGDTSGKAGGSTRRGYGQKAVPSHMMSAPQFRQYLAQQGVFISPEKAVAHVQSVAGCVKSGTTYAAPQRELMPLAKRLIRRAQHQGNDATEGDTLAG